MRVGFLSLFVERVLCTDLRNSGADGVGAVLKVGRREVDELCDFVHVALVKTSCRGGRRSEAQTACDKRGLGVVGYGVLVRRDVDFVKSLLEILALNADSEIVGYEFVSLGKMMDFIKKGDDANEAMKKAKGHYGQWDAAVKYIDPRQE